MSKLLIDERPLMILPKLADKIGLNEAIVVQQVHYWLVTSPIEKDGRKWIYNTYEEWHEQFPFWSVTTIGRIFRSLEDNNILDSKKFQAAGYDHTKWYSINYHCDIFEDTIMAHTVTPERNNLYTETNTESEEYFQNRPNHLVNRGETKTIKEGGIVNAVRVGQKLSSTIQGDFKRLLGLTPHWDTKTNQANYQFFRERYIGGETVMQFKEWWVTKDWRGRQGQMPSFKQVREMWGQAFIEEDISHHRKAD